MEAPKHISLLPVMVHVGNALTVRTLVQVDVQPDAFVTVTVYVPATVKLLMVAVAAVYPPGPLHE